MDEGGKGEGRRGSLRGGKGREHEIGELREGKMEEQGTDVVDILSVSISCVSYVSCISYVNCVSCVSCVNCVNCVSRVSCVSEKQHAGLTRVPEPGGGGHCWWSHPEHTQQQQRSQMPAAIDIRT